MNVRSLSLLTILTLMIFLGTGTASSQEIINVTLTLQNGSITVIDTLGYHPDATYCVDEALGELEMPPVGFDFDAVLAPTRSGNGGCTSATTLGRGVRLNLHAMPANQTTVTDTFKIQMANAGDSPTTTLSWSDLTGDAYKKITVALLQDAFGGFVVNQDMRTATTITFNNAVTTLFLYITVVNGIERVDNTIPGAFALQQNYPNPFNPTTNVTFSIEKTAMAEVAVFNLLGQKIATLANEELTPGVYSTTWNGTDELGRGVASGVYHLRMVARYTNAFGTEESFSQLRKIVLMK